MILAAGLGTRLKPFTEKHPKALAPVGGHTLLELNIKRLQQSGINDIVINVHHFAHQIIEYIRANNAFGANIKMSDESDTVLETGGGVKKAVSYFENSEDVLVCNVDILSNIDIAAMRLKHTALHADVTLAVQNRTSSRNLLFDQHQVLTGWRNNTTLEVRPAHLDWETMDAKAFSGIQIINRNFYNNIGLEGKFSLIDAYLDAMGSYNIKGYDHTGDLLLDVGKPEALDKAQELVNYVFNR